MLLWYANIAAQIMLCLTLLFKGHYTKYRVLFAYLIFEVFAFSALFYTYHTFGTHSHQYASAFQAKNLITITFSMGIILEGFFRKNRCIRIPQEIYLLLLFGYFISRKSEFTHIPHIVYECLRYSYLVITLWWIYCFRKEAPNERRNFRARR